MVQNECSHHTSWASLLHIILSPIISCLYCNYPLKAILPENTVHTKLSSVCSGYDTVFALSRSRSISGASSGLSTSPLSSPRVSVPLTEPLPSSRWCWPQLPPDNVHFSPPQHSVQPGRRPSVISVLMRTGLINK